MVDENLVRTKKQRFVQREAYKKKRLAKVWRKPQGKTNKIGKKSYALRPQVGYGSPKAIRGVHPLGLRPIMVNSLSDFEIFKTLDPKRYGAVIASSVGTKKRCELIKKANEISVEILNVKDAQAYLKQVESELQKRKEQKKAKAKAVEAKKKATAPAKKEKKEKEEDKLAEKIEEAAMQEKKEKDKLLTKKGSL